MQMAPLALLLSFCVASAVQLETQPKVNRTHALPHDFVGMEELLVAGLRTKSDPSLATLVTKIKDMIEGMKPPLLESVKGIQASRRRVSFQPCLALLCLACSLGFGRLAGHPGHFGGERGEMQRERAHR